MKSNTLLCQPTRNGVPAWRLAAVLPTLHSKNVVCNKTQIKVSKLYVLRSWLYTLSYYHSQLLSYYDKVEICQFCNYRNSKVQEQVYPTSMLWQKLSLFMIASVKNVSCQYVTAEIERKN
jgi:hypothetical protein